MKKIIASAFTLLFISNLTFAQTPTADQIIDKYLTAIGGKDAVSKIQDETILMSGEVQGTAVDVSSQKKVGNKVLMVVNVAGMGEVQKIQTDGVKARTSGQAGTIDLVDKPLKILMATQAPIFPELGYAAAGVKLNVTGTEKIDGKDAYKIEASLEDSKWTEYFDVATGLKIRTITTAETGAGSATITMTYGDYRDVSGVKFPYKLNQDTGMFQIDLTASKIEVNKGLADSLFDVK